MNLPARILKDEILNNPGFHKLSDEKQIVVKASINSTLRSYEMKDLVDKTNTLVKYICRDIGIKTEPDQFEKSRFLDVLLKYYYFLTLAEIKIAFELATIGKLDDYFKKNSSGNPDRNHYQTFSIEYVSKILNTYLKFKKDTMESVQKLLPMPSYRISDEQMEINRNTVLQDIINKFQAYKSTGKYPEFIIPHIITNIFYQYKLLPEPFEPSPDESALAVIAESLSQSLKVTDRKKAVKYFAGNKDVWEDLNIDAKNQIRLQKIKEVFDKLITDNIPIDTVFTLKADEC